MKNLACAAIVGMAVGLGALSVGGGGAASLASLAAVRAPMVVANLPISRPYLADISPISPQVRRPMAVVVGLISHREMIMDIKV